MVDLTPLTSQITYFMGIDDPLQLEQWLRGQPNLIGLCMVGRSNVGKSSLINNLFKVSLARISKTPGRTQKIHIFKFFLPQKDNSIPATPMYLFDLPGHGHAEVSKQMLKNWNELLGLFFQLLSPHVLVVNIQDARRPDMASDKEFSSFIRDYPFKTFLIFSKLDKLKTQKERHVLEKQTPLIYKKYKWVKQIHFVSNESKKGILQLRDSLESNLLLSLHLTQANETSSPAASQDEEEAP